MLVKLRFTTGKQPYDVFKIFDYLINNRPATGTDLKAYFTTAGLPYASIIDSTNSQIWNSGTGITALTGANTVSKFGKNVAATFGYIWGVEQTAYDNSTYKHLSTILDTASALVTTATPWTFSNSYTTGTGVSGFTSEAITTYAFNSATITTTGSLPYGGSQVANHHDTSYTGNKTTGGWLYITDNCFLWCIVGTNLQVVGGFPGGSNLSTANLRGHTGAMQYTRTDPWNTSTSGISPFVSTPQCLGGGFLGDVSHINQSWNVQSTSQAQNFPLIADKIVDSRYSTTNSTGPLISNTPVALGCGNRFNHLNALTSYANATQALSQTTQAGSQVGAPLNQSPGYRFLNSDLKSQTYALLPITWSIPYYNVAGGNITDKTGLYWFNGDYFPGDILTSGTKTYVLFPGVFDNGGRVALAVPRE